MDFDNSVSLPDGDIIRNGLPRMRFVDAMTRFGSDKPDTRYGLEISDVSSVLSQTENNEIPSFPFSWISASIMRDDPFVQLSAKPRPQTFRGGFLSR